MEKQQFRVCHQLELVVKVGLLDLKLHPDYATNGWIYISYSYQDTNNSNSGNTAIIRAKINASNQLYDIEEIYKGTPATSTSHHYGSRMVFDENNKLFFQ